MSHITKDMMQDRSTATEFVFSLRCAECGEEWRSTPVRFSRAGVTPATNGKQIIFDAL